MSSDLNFVVLREGALDFCKTFVSGILVLDGTEDFKVEVFGDDFSMVFDLVVVFLKFLEHVEELVFLGDHRGWQGVNPAEVETEEEPFEVEAEDVVEHIGRGSS